jgi:hypothetical protein
MKFIKSNITIFLTWFRYILLGEKISKKQKAKKFHKAKEIAYRKSKQPVTDGTGENSGSGVNIKLESVNEKQTQKLNEEFDRMKGLIGYNRKTQ